MPEHFATLEQLSRFYLDQGIDRLYVKQLAANDNSKNQVYFGPGFEALTLFPLGEMRPETSEKGFPIFKAKLDFAWTNSAGTITEAPSAQIILYPQYPEIRFSGFLKNAGRAYLDTVRDLMSSRLSGRIFLAGATRTGQVIGTVLHPDSPLAEHLRALFEGLPTATQIFRELYLPGLLKRQETPRQILLRELRRIHSLGWINSKRLNSFGETIDCNAPQCGGYTLEAELGITPNGRSEPDFMGWEIKQYAGSVLTLMTPEPTGGIYAESVEKFIRTYGYPDTHGRPDRLNFGGTHYCNMKHARTGLTLKLNGYDPDSGKITNSNGGIELTTDTGLITASWGFTGLLEHWNRKHRNAAYIPAEHQTTPNQYRYGSPVFLCEGTDPLKLISAVHSGKIYYDPGIKLENASSSRPTTKRRSQFRIKFSHIAQLYDSMSTENLLGDE